MKRNNGSKTAESSHSSAFLVSCPECRAEFELSTLVQAQISAQMQADVTEQIQRAREEERAASERSMQAAAKVQREESAALQEKIRTLEKRELATLEAERNLADLEMQLRIETEKQLTKERDSIRKSVEAALQARHERELAERDLQLQSLNTRMAEAQKTELDLRKAQINFEQRERGLDLELQKRLMEARPEIARQIREELQSESRLELEASRLEVERLQNQVGKLTDAAKNGRVSGEVIGESLERMLMDLLVTAFPQDRIVDVPRGCSGGDLVQTLVNPAQQEVGRILWECKNVKNWNNDWIAKARASQQQADADVAVIVTRALPREVKAPFGMIEGIWVSEINAAGAIAVALRHVIFRLFGARTVSETRDARLQALHHYLMSPAFTIQCQQATHAIGALQSQLESEQRALQRAWSSRRKHLQLLGSQVAGIIGSIEGTLQAELPAGAAIAQIDFSDSVASVTASVAESDSGDGE